MIQKKQIPKLKLSLGNNIFWKTENKIFEVKQQPKFSASMLT